MKFLATIILLTLTACGSNAGYQGRSAWSEFNKNNNSNKSFARSSYPNSAKNYIIPKQIKPQQKVVTSQKIDRDELAVVMKDKSVTVKTQPSSAKTTHFSDNSVRRKINKDIVATETSPARQMVMEEQYFSAAGSTCIRKRTMISGNLEANVICKHKNGEQKVFSDLTL